MEIVKGLLMGCGALALLGLAGCVGLMGVGSYALDQAIEEQELRQAERQNVPPPRRREVPADPFSDYQGASDDSELSSDWGDESR